jgi:hypothetical protein
MNPQSTIEPTNLNNPNPAPAPSSESAPAPLPKDERKSKKPLLILLVILLLAGGVFGGYVYGKGQDNGSTKQATVQPAAPATAQDNSAVHFVLSEGYPFDIGAKKIFTTKLGVPADLQAVRASSNNSNQQYFTDKSNDELAHFIVGNPTDSADNGGGESTVSVLAISKSWLAANLPANLADDAEMTTGYKITTAADKQKFLQTLKSTTAECVKDSKKGFTTSDKSFNVCYTLYFGREGYSPSITLSGYGEKELVPMFLSGQINIYDSTPMANQDAELKGIADAKNGKYTAKFSSSLSTLLAALKQTTLTTADNPAKTQ